MDFSSVRRTSRCEFAECVGIGCHEHRHIFGGDSATVFVGDAKRNVVVLVIPFVTFRDGRLTLLVLHHGRDALPTWDSIAYWERGTKGPGSGF